MGADHGPTARSRPLFCITPSACLTALLLLVACAPAAPSWVAGRAARDVRACGAGEPWGSGSVAREGGLLRLRGGKHGGVKAKELWEKDEEELQQLEEDLRHELMSLRVAQQVGGQPGRVNRISMVRKSIARVLTVITAKQRGEFHAKYEKAKFKPYEVRFNKHWTRAMRRKLNKFERERVSLKALKARRGKYWAAGERPMAKVVIKQVGRVIPQDVPALHEDQLAPRTAAQYHPRKYGMHGKRSGPRVTHIPEHARAAMEKREAKWALEKKRLVALKEKKRARMQDDSDE